MTDNDELLVDDVEIGPPQTSVDKLEAALEQLAGARSQDPGSAMLINTAKALLPSLRKLGYIPSDPAELDTILLAGARFMLGMRSDSAWQPETIDELFLGPDPDPDPTEEP